MKKKIYITLFYFFIIFQISQNILSEEKYKELDKVVAIVEKEVITEIELKSAIKQVLSSTKNQGKTVSQYKELLKANVLNQLIEKSLIEQYAIQYGITVEQKKIDSFIENVAKKNKNIQGRRLLYLRPRD